MQENILKKPAALDAEAYIIGCMLLYPDTVEDILSQLRSIDFADERNKLIFEAVESLSNRNAYVDQTTVINELEIENKLNNVGGIDYIYNLIANVPSSANIDAYAQLVNEKSMERRLFDCVDKIREDILKGNTNHDDLMIKAENEFNYAINDTRGNNLSRVDSLTEKVMDIIAENKKNEGHLVGVDTGYKMLNEYTSGFKKGELIILAARPSIGKSTFALNIATHVAATKDKGRDRGVAFFSLEMGYDQLIMRLLATESSVDLKRIVSGDLTDEEMGLLEFARNKINKLHLYFDEASNTTLRYIKLQCQKLKRENRLDMIVIDYLQLLASGEKDNTFNRTEYIARLTRGLKEMARSFEVPVLALSQLSRNIETREDKTPVLSDLRESGNIEQDADIVMFLHRESPKKDDSAGPDTTKVVYSAKTELIIAKNRQGTTGRLNLIFKGASSQFVDYEEKR